MYYEKNILQLDDDGHFLVATHFRQHSVGGEATRESKHVYIAYGHIDSLDSMTDITEKICIDRPANKDEEKHFLQISTAQKKMGHDEQAWNYAHQASLATRPAQFVPRSVMSSNNGIILFGIECKSSSGLGSSYVAYKTFDINNGKLTEFNKSFWPFTKALASPKSLSCDGKVVIGLDVSKPSKPRLAEQKLSDKKIVTLFEQVQPISTFVALKGFWVALNEDYVYRFNYGDGEETVRFKSPKGILPWSAEPAINGSLVAVSGNKGLVCVIDAKTGEIKKYYPHRGCKRDETATVKLSGNGKWMASKTYMKSELVVTDLEKGISWKVADLSSQTVVEKESEGFRSESIIPAAFGFVSSQLLVSESDGIDILSLVEPDNHTLAFVSEQGKPGARVPLKLTPKAPIEKIIKQAKLERVSELVKGLYYPACKLISKKPKKSGWYMPERKGAPTLGESRFGGWPDLPSKGQWPIWNDRPMGFLGQINLAELSAVQCDIRLPKDGLLLFFLGCSEDTYDSEHFDQECYMVDILLGTKPGDKGGWKIIYVKPGIPLERTVYKGKVLPEVFAPSMLRVMKGGLTLPNEETAAYDCIDFNAVERENFNEVLDLISEELPENQVSGYPNLIQSMPPEVSCHLASLGQDPFSTPKTDTSEYKKLMKHASEYGLLFQFTSDNNPGFLWGDGGHLYFYGKRKEMELGNFDHCWVFYEN